MHPEEALHLAKIVLAFHMAIALFIVVGMIAIPIGALRHRPFVFGFAWRFAHLAVAFGIALQKVMGQTCFLSVWEFNLLDRARLARAHIPLIHAWAINIMHWNMPVWFFTVLYVCVLLYIILMWHLVPPQLPWHGLKGGVAGGTLRPVTKA